MFVRRQEKYISRLSVLTAIIRSLDNWHFSELQDMAWVTEKKASEVPHWDLDSCQNNEKKANVSELPSQTLWDY